MWCSKCRMAIDPSKRAWLMAQLSCRSNDDAALNENLFYAICDQVDWQVCGRAGGEGGPSQIGAAAAGQRLLRLHTQPIACLVSIRMSFALIRIAERLPSGNNFMHSQGEWRRGEVAGGSTGAVRQCPLMPNVDGNCRPSTLDNSHVALCFMQLTGRVF